MCVCISVTQKGPFDAELRVVVERGEVGFVWNQNVFLCPLQENLGEGVVEDVVDEVPVDSNVQVALHQTKSMRVLFGPPPLPRSAQGNRQVKGASLNCHLQRITNKIYTTFWYDFMFALPLSFCTAG